MKTDDRDSIRIDAGNFGSHLRSVATRHIEAGELEAAGAALVLERIVYDRFNAYMLATAKLVPAAETTTAPRGRRAAAPPAAPAPAAAAPATRSRGPKCTVGQRHAFDKTTGVCKCGARKDGAAPEATEGDGRTLTLPGAGR